MTDDGTKPDDAAERANADLPEDDAKLADVDLPEDEALIGLIKRATRLDADTHPPDFLRKVQRRIRQRSRGRFFRDGWRASQTRLHYALAALLLLLLVALVYFAMMPSGFGP